MGGKTMRKRLYGDLCHDILRDNAKRKLAYREDNDLEEWKKSVREKFIQLFGIDRISENICDLNVSVEDEVDKGSYRQIRFTFESEKGAVMPCYLLLPHKIEKKIPLAILVQGHSTGFHNSIGEPKFEEDKKNHPRVCWGIQAVENGFAALCMEQRAFGELGSPRSYGEDVVFKPRTQTCAFASLTAFNLGRTLIGERVWDVSRAIDAVKTFEDLGIDMDKIMITGNSGGGTASYYSACYDERIKYSVPSCAFCSFKKSIMDIEHCACNYVPFIMDWFEMEDVSVLIAPRNLTVVAGKRDKIFPIEGVYDSFDTVKKIYKRMGAENNCDLLETPKDHYWCDDLVWEQVRKDAEKMGWKLEK